MENYQKSLEKARELHETSSPEVRLALEKVFTELVEDEDEKIRKRLIYIFKSYQNSKTHINPNNWEGLKITDILGWLEKQRKQKPDSGPKFKVGDWVVSPNGVYWHIDAISNNRYEVSSVTGECADWPLSTDLYHRWSIQDAKPGDIIATLDYILIFKGHLEKEGGTSYCHYDFGADNPQFIWLEDNNWYFGEKAVLSPATKEQRDLLFQKMHEAGYEWESDSCKLKQIKQSETSSEETKKPTEWSEDDKQMLDAAISFVEHSGFTTIGKGKNATIEWLKSLQPQNLMKALQEANKMISELINENISLKEEEWTKEDEENLTYISAALDAYCQLRKERNNTSAQEKLDAAIEWLDGRFKSIKPKLWSPEDIDMLEDIINDAEQHCHLDLDQRDWLKNIKERALWRPSEEQLKALEYVIQEESNSELIKELYNKLSKL